MASSSNPHVVPRTSAWRAKQKEIDEFIQGGLNGQRTRVSYLYGAHGSGKSTTLVQHICDMVEQKTAHFPLVYVLPNRVDWIKSQSYHGQERGKIDESGPLILTFYKHFMDLVTGGRLARGATNLVDVELRASVTGEIFFGHLLDLVKKNDPVMTILLMAPHLSGRTITAFSRVTEAINVIKVPDINPRLNIKLLGEDWEEIVNYRLLEIRQRDPTSIAFFSAPSNERLAGITGQKLRVTALTFDDLLTSIRGGHNVVLDPEIGTSQPTLNLRLIVSLCSATSFLFDTETSQVIQKKRIISRAELEREMSWAYKTTLDPKAVQVFACVTKDEAERMTKSGDPWGPAWNMDVLFMALRVVKEWPNRNLGEFPIRNPPDALVLVEMLRRLSRVQCISHCGQGRYKTTTKGDQVLSVSAMTQDLLGVDFNIAYLLASVFNYPQKLNVQRVIIRLAAIAMSKTCCFVSRATPNIPLSPSILNQCAGVGLKQWKKGGMWIALGIYLKANQDRRLEELGLIRLGEAVIDRLIGVQIKETVYELEKRFKIPNVAFVEHEVALTTLTDDEIMLVEKELMWAWLHQTIAIDVKDGNMYDLVSMKGVHIGNEEMVNVEAMRQNPQNQRIGRMRAFYHRMRCDSNGRYTVEDITFVTQRYYKDIERASGIAWPGSIMTSYPQH